MSECSVQNIKKFMHMNMSKSNLPQAQMGALRNALLKQWIVWFLNNQKLNNQDESCTTSRATGNWILRKIFIWSGKH